MDDPVVTFRCSSQFASRVGPSRRLLVATAALLAVYVAASNDGGLPPYKWAVAGGFALLLVLAYFVPTVVRLKEDELRIWRYGVWRRIPYGAIARVEMTQRLGASVSENGDAYYLHTGVPHHVHTGVRLTLHDGEELDLATGVNAGTTRGHSVTWTGQLGNFDAFDRKAFTMKDAIAERVETARKSSKVSPLARGLMRGGRSTKEWLQHLEALVRPNGYAYRTNAPPVEALWRVVEDPETSWSARVGAAIALRRSLDASGKERLSVVIEESSSPRLRRVLSVAIDEQATDRALFEVLEEVEDPEPLRHARR